MIADVNIHDINSHNPHAHIMLTMRDLIPFLESFDMMNEKRK
jgi:hypothetical protein